MAEDTPKFDKGDTVAIVEGKRNIGVRGEIFWSGPNKYGPGSRFGIKTRDGRTLWVDETQVGPEEGAPPEPPPPERPPLDKGARVRIIAGRDGVGQEAEVFWAGESKYGPGMRYGVKNDADETFWVDEAEVEALGGGDDKSAGSREGGAAPYPEDEAPAAAPVRAADFEDAPFPGDDDYAEFEEEPPF